MHILRHLALIASLLVSLSVTAGEVILKKTFDSPQEVNKKEIGFRKQTQHKVADGIFHAIPPKLADKKIDSVTVSSQRSSSKWATSTFARVNFNGAPQDYVCTFRWKYNKPADAKSQARGVAYLDMGHRCVRLTMKPDGTTLLLENHLVGKDADPNTKILATNKDLKLTPDLWYDVVAKVNADTVSFTINGQTLHGKDPLIAKKPYDTFNVDVNGAGFQLDHIEIKKATN